MYFITIIIYFVHIITPCTRIIIEYRDNHLVKQLDYPFFVFRYDCTFFENQL